MTPRDRVLMALNHREPDIVPYNIPIDPEPARRLDEYYGGPEWRSRVQNHVVARGVDWAGPRPAEGEWTDRFGVRWMQGSIFHSVDVPLKEPSIEGYEWPELLPEEELGRHREWAEANGHLFRVANMGLLFFERAWCLRGMEDLLADFVENPGFVEELFDGLMEMHFGLIDRLATLPVDGLGFGDDFGAQKGLLMGTGHWRRVLKPRLKQMYNRTHEHGKFVHIHCCGDVSPIIEDLIEIGVDIYNPLQPEPQDIYAMKREYGGHITFEGGIGTQELLPRGTPDRIRGEIRRLKRELGRDGGFVLSPTKPILPDVPTENAVACVEAILEP